METQRLMCDAKTCSVDGMTSQIKLDLIEALTTEYVFRADRE